MPRRRASHTLKCLHVAAPPPVAYSRRRYSLTKDVRVPYACLRRSYDGRFGGPYRSVLTELGVTRRADTRKRLQARSTPSGLMIVGNFDQG